MTCSFMFAVLLYFQLGCNVEHVKTVGNLTTQ